MYCQSCGEENPDSAAFCISCGNPFGELTAPSKSAEFAGYAGFWLRWVAAIIDSIICSIAGFIAGAVGGGIIGGMFYYDLDFVDSAATFFGGIAGLIIRWLYFTVMESSIHQATLGKRAMGIIVVDEDFNRISFGRANGRYFGKILSVITIYVGYIIAGFTEKKQALHDLIAGTLVVNK